MTNRTIQNIITVDSNYTVHVTEDVIIELFYFEGSDHIVTLLHIFKGDYLFDQNGYIYFKGGQYYNRQDELRIRLNREYGILYEITVHGQIFPPNTDTDLLTYQHTTEIMPYTIQNGKGFRIRLKS